jgi:hypothetical protein
MYRAVVTTEARAIQSFRGKRARRLQMTDSTILVKHRMWLREPAAAVNAGVLQNAVFSNPNQC